MAPHPDGADLGDPGAWDNAMGALRDRARVTNLTRVEVIAVALAAMHDGGLPEEARLGARGAAHTLAGSAGTFGFDEASELGRTLEALLDDVAGTKDMRDRAQRGLGQVALLREALADPTVATTPAPTEDEDSP